MLLNDWISGVFVAFLLNNFNKYQKNFNFSIDIKK